MITPIATGVLCDGPATAGERQLCAGIHNPAFRGTHGVIDSERATSVGRIRNRNPGNKPKIQNPKTKCLNDLDAARALALILRGIDKSRFVSFEYLHSWHRNLSRAANLEFRVDEQIGCGMECGQFAAVVAGERI